MSYCRWSSDDYLCDLYVYEDCRGGWTTHVAERRPVFKGPLPPPLSIGASIDEWFERDRVVSEMLKVAGHVEIGLPHDGATFNDPTPEAAADRLEALKGMGYNVPQYAIDDLRAESEEPIPANGSEEPRRGDYCCSWCSHCCACWPLRRGWP